MKTHEIYIPKLSDNIIFWSGINAQDNINIIENSDPSDIWFHVSDYPSAHVIARISEYSKPLDRSDKKLMLSIIKQGAVLCKQISKYASVTKLSITYAQVSNITPTEILGTVNVKLGKNIII